MTQVWNADLCSHRKGGVHKNPQPPPGTARACGWRGATPGCVLGRNTRAPEAPAPAAVTALGCVMCKPHRSQGHR